MLWLRRKLREAVFVDQLDVIHWPTSLAGGCPRQHCRHADQQAGAIVAVELDTQDAECSGGLTCGLRRMLTLQTVLHLDRDETSDEDTVEYGYDAGEAVWNFPGDRLLNLTGVTGLPDFTNGQSIDGFFI